MEGNRSSKKFHLRLTGMVRSKKDNANQGDLSQIPVTEPKIQEITVLS